MLDHKLVDFITSLQLFNYVDWREDEVERVLCTEYGWEFALDVETSWRIGDGTAPFYSYIYHTIAGFFEFDTLRSNQIRAGHLDRATALARMRFNNRPRFEAIRAYVLMIEAKCINMGLTTGKPDVTTLVTKDYRFSLDHRR